MFYVFPRVVSKKECEKLLDYCIKNTEFQDGQIGISKINKDGRLDPSIRKTDIAFIEPDGNEGNQVNEIAWHYLNQANEINTSFNYKIDTFEAVQFARYRDGGHYDWHRDLQENLISANGVMRKLSLTFCLSDPNKYEGGELQFYNGERPRLGYTLSDGTEITAEQIKEDIRSQGSVIVFDSRDWHRVTPVTKGTRYSIVCWSVGPNFV